MGKFIDLTGQKFGMLTVLGIEGKNKSGTILWTCRCDCGNETTSRVATLKNGHKKSCGCFRKTWTVSAKTKHGHNKVGHTSPEYNTWQNMIQRCKNPNNNRYADWGGRGICVTGRWLDSFENFLNDMGYKPSSKHSIDRIDVNGDYEPNNCRWATTSEQAINTRSRTSKSGHRGVYWHAQNRKWTVQISVNKKRFFIGIFDNLSEAVEARKEAELKYWGKSS